MQGKYHFVCAAGAGVATVAIFHNEFSSLYLGSALVLVGSIVGGLIPDIDSPTSAFGKPLKPVSKLINKAFGHRTITHSGLWIVPLLLLYLYTKNEFVLGYLIGFVSHLFSDTLTSGGIPWLYPLEKKRLRLTRIKSGDGDMLLTILSIAIFVLGNFAVRYFMDNPVISK